MKTNDELKELTREWHELKKKMTNLIEEEDFKRYQLRFAYVCRRIEKIQAKRHMV